MTTSESRQKDSITFLPCIDWSFCIDLRFMNAKKVL